ncbi:hypothetical protein BB561_001474 [Smittium simulii]|uniref:Cytochrome b-c1 complex subunit 7 n=1 Tax=Smittium simulii TaxID=133385 RepID=A0A2T9YUF9_9FUNG|nr:hypothetical protein BB561_001474 [Smittium simulii]
MASKIFRAVLRPFSEPWARASGYRKYGLIYDDLIIEESPVAQEALRRLPREVMDQRIFRLKQAFQLSLSFEYLPSNLQPTPEQDKAYFLPLIKQVQAETNEREAFDSLQFVK